MPTGRPSAFKKEYTKRLLEYFDVEPYREVERRQLNKRGEEFITYEDKPNDMPTLAGFAIEIGVSRQTLWNWANEKNEDGTLKRPEFFDACMRAKQFQEKYLVVNGTKGLINPQFSMFVAKNYLQWRDKQPGEEDKKITHQVEGKVQETDWSDRINELKDVTPKEIE